ncbi:MAG TPA: XRE family transcriptional regulator [Terriglobales bacterium]|nr:XRE family transcriptional regulator [Terriglobales bacterium]
MRTLTMICSEPGGVAIAVTAMGTATAAHGLSFLPMHSSSIRPIWMQVALGMTKAKAVKRFGITQARLEDLLRGRIGKFSVDALMNMATAGGLRVRLRTGEVR